MLSELKPKLKISAVGVDRSRIGLVIYRRFNHDNFLRIVGGAIIIVVVDWRALHVYRSWTKIGVRVSKSNARLYFYLCGFGFIGCKKCYQTHKSNCKSYNYFIHNNSSVKLVV